MKRLLPIILILSAIAYACNSDNDNWEKYKDWREANEKWLEELQQRKDADGKPYYQTIVPSWNPSTFVLLHYYGDPAENADELAPMYSSIIDVRYKLHLMDNDAAVDSSDHITTYGTPGIYRTQLKSLIPGWAIGMPYVHCGDSVEMIVPYTAGYGSEGSGAVKPYSALRFNIRLVDIYKYEASPY